MPPTSHTLGLPSPRDRELWICKSGRADGSFAFQLNTAWPTARPSSPGTASRTIWNPEPAGRWKTAEQSSADPVGDITVPSAAASLNATIAGPVRGVTGVSRSRTCALTSAALATPSPLISAPTQPAPPVPPVSSPNRCAARSASWVAGSPTHCASAGTGAVMAPSTLHSNVAPMQLVRMRV